MRCCERNKQVFYYALFASEEPAVDEYGNETGGTVVVYSAPVRMSANVSAARGTADVEMFGINTAYSKTIVTDDLDCPITESSIIWLGITPDSNGETGTVKHNYAVERVAKSLNNITYAIRKVEVS